MSPAKSGNTLPIGKPALSQSYSSRDYQDKMRLQVIGVGFAENLDEILRILSTYRGHPVLNEAILMGHMGEKFGRIGINQPRNRSTKKLAGRR